MKHFIATVEMLQQSIAEHNADLTAHGSQKVVVRSRVRDPEKPTYGLDDEGEGGDTNPIALEASAYTGTAAVSAVVSGTEYDVHNLSNTGEANPDGTIIFN